MNPRHPSLQDPLPEHERVAVLGMGETGLAAAALLVACGKQVTVMDSRARAQLPPELKGVEARPGTLDARDFGAVVISPGLNPTWPEHAQRPDLGGLLERAHADGRTILSEVSLARRAFRGRVVAVGGTDGKSTTAALTAHLAQSLCEDSALGGNSWTPMSGVLLRRPGLRLLIAEISAFQLWQPHDFAPNVAILTNIAPDHLDHYADEAAYVAAKEMLLAHVEEGVLLYSGDARLAERAAALREMGRNVMTYNEADPAADARIEHIGNETVFSVPCDDRRLRVPTRHLGLPGAHNLRNALAALTACLAGLSAEERERVTPDALGGAMESFRGLRHRLERVRTLNGVHWFNDSKATNIHAAVTGLRSLPAAPLVVITGGVDKALPLEPLLETLEERARAVIAIGELRSTLQREARGRFPLTVADSLETAVAMAARHAEPGDVVVLSPAASSFDMFSGFEERGEIFRRAVQNLRAH